MQATPPIRTFLEAVDRQVLRLGPRDYLAAERLLRSREQWTRDELRAALASLIACDPDQWEQVGRVFEAYLAGERAAPSRKPGPPTPPDASQPSQQRVSLRPATVPTRGERAIARLRALAGSGIETARNAPRGAWLGAIVTLLVVGVAFVVVNLPSTPTPVDFLLRERVHTAGTEPVPEPVPDQVPDQVPEPVPDPVPEPELRDVQLIEIEPPLEREIERPSPRTGYYVLAALSLLSLTLCGLGVRLWRLPAAAKRARERRAERRRSASRSERQRLDQELARSRRALEIQYRVDPFTALSPQAILDSADCLGRLFREERSDELDADGTLNQTVAEGGRFVPVLAPRRARQELLVLVDVEKGDHPWLAGFVRVLDAWRKLGVRLLRYKFSMTPGSVIDAETRQSEPIEDLARRAEGLPLIVFSRMLSVETRRGEAGWIAALGAWPVKAWLDPDPRPISDLDGPRRMEVSRLKRSGLHRFPLTDPGVVALARWLAAEGEGDPSVEWPPLLSLPPGIPRGHERTAASELADHPADELAEAMRKWALAAALVPDPKWDQVEAIRRHFPEIREAAPDPRYLQRLLEWVERETGEDPEFRNGRCLRIPEPIQDRWIRDQREREDRDPDQRGFEARVRRLLLDQLASTCPEGGLERQWWELKCSLHKAVLNPSRARELLGWVYDSAIAHEASRWVDQELQRQREEAGPSFSVGDVDYLQDRCGRAPGVGIGELFWGHWRLWGRAALMTLPSAVLLALGWWGWSSASVQDALDRLAQTTVTGRSPADYEVQEVQPLPGSRQVWTIDTVEFAFRWVPAGEDLLGSPLDEPCRSGDEQQWTAVFSNGFWMGETEVTQRQWTAVMGVNPSGFDDCGPTCPVENVRWGKAREFIEALNQKVDGGGFRLPTEPEWEYAARAGSDAPFGRLCGDYREGNCRERVPCLDRIGWYAQNSLGKTHEAARFQGNAWGLYDMQGNVSEWCADWYDARYPSGRVSDYSGPRNGPYRVVRGGSWRSYPRNARVAFRHWRGPSDRYAYVGFRIARSWPSEVLPSDDPQ